MAERKNLAYAGTFITSGQASLRHSIFSIGLFTNCWTLVGSLAMFGAKLLFTYLRVMNRLFHSAPLAAESWLRIVGIAAMAFVAVEFESGCASAGELNMP